MWVQTVVEHRIPLYLLGAILGIGVIGHLIAQITLKRMIKEAENIHSSNHGLMKLVKAKFEHATMRSGRVNNVAAFVDKYLYEYRVLGLRFLTWQYIEIKCLWISVGIGVLGASLQYLYGGMGEMVFQYGAWTGISSMILFLLYVMSGADRKIQAIRTYVLEYLENVYVCRYVKIESEEGKRIETEEIQEEVLKEEVTKAVKEAEKEEEEKDTSREMRIREILEEFLA